jgi:diketogulonate reductase-like aldo/keto reductase
VCFVHPPIDKSRKNRLNFSATLYFLYDSVQASIVEECITMSLSQHITLPDGTCLLALGQGTWFIGDQQTSAQDEIRALQQGLDLGLSVIDTAEMYGDGRSESLVGQAIAERRHEVFLVSKVYPHHAGGRLLPQACEASLRRLGTECLDLYLLHWRGNIPLQDTVAGMESLIRQGKIKHWGVSNFDTADMQELWQVEGGSHCQINQVLYHLGSRGTEIGLQPWMRDHHVPLMAYSPLAQAGKLRQQLVRHPVLVRMAAAYQVSVLQIVLAWALHQHQVLAIPKAGQAAHVLQNAQAAELALTDADLAALDQAFPAPTHAVPLDMI